MAQNMEEQLKDALKKLMSDGTLSNILIKKMKATMKYMICEKGEYGEASGSVNAKIDKGKSKVTTLGLFIEDDEYYQAMRGTLP